jgi:hypothetical protein
MFITFLLYPTAAVDGAITRPSYQVSISMKLNAVRRGVALQEHILGCLLHTYGCRYVLYMFAHNNPCVVWRTAWLPRRAAYGGIAYTCL